MEGSEQLNGLIGAMTSIELWQAIAVFIVGFVIVNMIKNLANNIFQFILIQMDMFGIGTHVEYKGKRGVITEISLRRTVIKLDDEDAYMYIRNTDRKFLFLIMPNQPTKEIKEKE